jgi:hypothetical protein
MSWQCVTNSACITIVVIWAVAQNWFESQRGGLSAANAPAGDPDGHHDGTCGLWH